MTFPCFPAVLRGQLWVKDMLLIEETATFPTLSHFWLSDFLNWLSITGLQLHDLWKKTLGGFLDLNLLIGPFLLL